MCDWPRATSFTHDAQGAAVRADRVNLINAGCLALQQLVTLARARVQGDAALAALEKRILARVRQEAPAEKAADTHPSA